MVGGAVFGWSSWMVVVGMIRIGRWEDAVCRGWMGGLWFVLGGSAMPGGRDPLCDIHIP